MAMLIFLTALLASGWPFSGGKEITADGERQGRQGRASGSALRLSDGVLRLSVRLLRLSVADRENRGGRLRERGRRRRREGAKAAFLGVGHELSREYPSGSEIFMLADIRCSHYFS